MKQIIFIILFIVFTIFEVYITIQFKKKKLSNYLNETIISYLGFCLYLLIEFLCKFSVSEYILILVMLTIFGHTFIGDFLNYYNKSKRFDRYLHAYGSFSFALFAYFVIEKTIKPVINSNLFSALFVVTLGISLGVIFEIIEFSHDTALKTQTQRGLKDTDFDLIADVIGSAIAGIFAFCVLL